MLSSSSREPSAPSSSLELTVRRCTPVLQDPTVTEICINRPGELFIETAAGGGVSRGRPRTTTGACGSPSSEGIQRINGLMRKVLLSASLPSGERVQIVAASHDPRDRGDHVAAGECRGGAWLSSPGADLPRTHRSAIAYESVTRS
jgi:hypothetical protein